MASRSEVQAELESLRELEALRLHEAQEQYREGMNILDRLWAALLKEEPPAAARRSVQPPLMRSMERAG